MIALLLAACRGDPCLDADGDGFFAGTCAIADDCDDSDPFVFPGAAEACDGVDNDCSGAADEPWDDDRDGWSECGGDCDDREPRDAPGLSEVCDGVDNNCDGDVDEGFDQDGDGRATCRGDCDDSDPAVWLGAAEACDGVDNDCDPSTSEAGDLDGDGQTLCGGDCDDLSPASHSGGTEVCDGADNDCNGEVDELIDCWGCVDTGPWRICPVYASWPDARAACQAFGGDLAVAADDATNAALSDAVAQVTGDSVWIGLTDAGSEGAWTWVDGVPLGVSSWGAGEPNDSGNEDCAGTNFTGPGFWNDFQCATALPFACDL